jgi:hypothetical protein
MRRQRVIALWNKAFSWLCPGSVIERTTMRSNPRRSARIAAAAAVVIVAGTIPGARATTAPGGQATNVDLAYSCAFPSGPQLISVRVQADFPGSATVGRPVQPSGVKLTVTVPAAAAADLTKGGTGAVAGLAQLAATVSRAGSHREVLWPPLVVPPTPPAAGGDLRLAAAGSVPAETTGHAGTVTFAAAGLSLVLATHQTGGGGARKPLKIKCTPEHGQDTALASVPVSATAGSAGGRALRAAPLDDTDGDLPPECVSFEPADVSGCTFLTGYSDVKKLGGAALIKPGMLDIALFNATECGDLRFCIAADVKLNYIPSPGQPGLEQLPPSPATFLTFGFMPTKATLELTQHGLLHIAIVLDFGDFSKSSVTATGDLMIRLFDVMVNGRALDVGDRCRTATPVHFELTADPVLYTINDGGILSGFVTIPPFDGCGVGEDLDPLLTGSISGPDNFLKMTQGNLCTFDPPPAFGCPPTLPTPQG